MALRIVNTARLDELEHYVRRIEAERDELKTRLKAADRRGAELQAKLLEAKRPVPTGLTDITTALRAAVPTIVQTPGYPMLTTAKDARAYAQGLHLLLRAAHLAGVNEGTAK